MEKDLKLSESLLQMSNIHETLDHFCSIIKVFSISSNENNNFIRNPLKSLSISQRIYHL